MKVPPLLWLLAAAVSVNLCHGRPQQQQAATTTTTTIQASSDIETTNLTTAVAPESKEDAFFATGAWRPVVSDVPAIKHELTIDQDRSRVRLETGDGGKQRAAKSPSTVENGTASVNETGRAKQSAALGDSIQSLANQLLGSNYFGKESDESERDSGENDSSASMVEEDIRTPPKLKSQVKHKQNNQHVKAPAKTVTSTTQQYTESDEIHNKGVAVPVIIEDDEDVEKTMEKLSYSEPLSVSQIITSTTPKKRLTTKITTPTTTRTTTPKPLYETTSSDGVSTWILLSGSSSSTTPTVKRKNSKTPTPTYIKSSHTTPAGDLYKNSPLYSSTIFTTSTTRPIRPITHNPSQNLRKNVTQTIDFFEPARTRKPHPTRTTTMRTTTTTTSPAPVSSTTKRRPTTQLLSTQKVLNRVTTIKPPVVTIIRVPEATPDPIPEEIEENDIEEGSTEDSTETTTKQTRQPTNGNKKRKKNKNRRRRPTKKPGTSEDPESKIDDDNAASSNNKIAIKERPLSTRIYNYLAREVMPSVGVGLIGLVVTAGLAGLFMYPFGGGLVTRRTYEEAGPHHHMSSPNGYYHPGEYQGEMEGGQSEEEVFGKLLEGMNDKGEFTYSGIGEETTGYAGASGDVLNEHDNRYKTGVTRLEESSSYNPSGDTIHGTHQKIRYSGGRIDDTNRYNGRIRYETVQGPLTYSQETYTGENKGNPTYTQFGGSGGFPTDSSKEKQHPYSQTATKSGKIEDSRETQPIYSATINARTKQYSVGSVHMDTNPHIRTAGTVSSENTGFGSSFYKPHYAEAQPYIDDMYKGLAVVGSQNYGNVQVDSKHSAVHTSGAVVGEVSTGTKYKTASIPESNPIASQQYRRLIPESKQQYRDVIGTQPRSSGTIVAVSVSKEQSSQSIDGEKQENINSTKFNPIHVNKDTDESKEEQNASDRTLEVQNDQTDQQQWDNLRYRGFSEVLSDLSKTSAELQRRGSLQAGLMEQGPRSLRRKRNVDNFSNSKDNDIDLKLNEIDSDDKNMELNWKKDKDSETSPQAEKNQSITMENNNDEMITGTLSQQSQDLATETQTLSANDEVTTLSAENSDLATDLVNDITTIETEIPTTTDYSIDDDVEEDDDDEDEDHDGTEKPHNADIMLRKNETLTKRPNYSVPTKVPDTQFSLLGLFRRIARFKLQMGLNLLKSTTQAFTNYIDRVQKRIDRDYYSSRSFSGKRLRRAVLKSDISGKKLEEKLRYQSKKQHSSFLKTIQRAVMN